MATELTGRIREGTPTGDPSQWQVQSEEPFDPWKVSGQQHMGEYLKAQGADATPKPEDVQADETQVPGAPPTSPAAPVAAAPPVQAPVDWKPVNEEPVKPQGRGIWQAIKDYPAHIVQGLLELPKQAFGASEQMRTEGPYDPAPVVSAAMLPMGTGAVAGVPLRAGETTLGAGAIRKTPVAAAATKEVANKLSDDLQALRQSSVADRAEVGNTIRALPPQAVGKDIGEKLYHAAENPAEAATLTPEEQAINQQHLAPLRQEQAALAKEATDLGGGELVGDPNYMHRIAKGHAPQYDSLSGSDFDPVTGTRGLPRTTSALQERKFYVAESPTGVRKVVSESPNGVNVWNNGRPTNIATDGELVPGETIDLGGKPWKVGQATTKEIEQHGAFTAEGGGLKPAEYHKNAFVNTADAVVRLREVVRNLKFVDEVKKSPWWLDHAVQATGNRPAPKGWREPMMPQFKGWKVDPKIADVLDDFYKPGILEPENALRKINQFATSSMFWNPIPHMQNVGVHWAVGRGWDWIRPGPMRHFATDMTRAIKATVTQNADYRRFLRQGGGLVYGGVKNADFYGEMARHMGMEIEKNWSQYQPLFKKLGISKPAEAVAWWYGKMRETLWASSDMFMMHRYLELERKGMSPMRAMKEAERHIPNYRIPAEVLGSRTASRVLQEPAAVVFARYHYGMWKSFMNMATDLAKGTPAEKKEALGNVAALAFMGYVAYPIVDAIYQKVTGDPNARLLRRGAMSVPRAAAEMTRDREGFSQFLQSSITAAPATREILQQFFGKDFFTGREMGGVVPRAEHAAKALVSPYGTAAQATDPNEAARSVGRTALDTVVGGENVSEKTEQGKRYGAVLREREARRHEEKPQGPIERAYYGAKKALGLGTPPKEKKPKEKKSHHNKEKGY